MLKENITSLARRKFDDLKLNPNLNQRVDTPDSNRTQTAGNASNLRPEELEKKAAEKGIQALFKVCYSLQPPFAIYQQVTKLEIESVPCCADHSYSYKYEWAEY